MVMKFKLLYASKQSFSEESYVELSTLEDLEDLVYSLPAYTKTFKNNRSVIVNFNTMTITVYDDCIE